jgi:hypothetical protein
MVESRRTFLLTSQIATKAIATRNEQVIVVAAMTAVLSPSFITLDVAVGVGVAIAVFDGLIGSREVLEGKWSRAVAVGPPTKDTKVVAGGDVVRVALGNVPQGAPTRVE